MTNKQILLNMTCNKFLHNQHIRFKNKTKTTSLLISMWSTNKRKQFLPKFLSNTKIIPWFWDLSITRSAHNRCFLLHETFWRNFGYRYLVVIGVSFQSFSQRASTLPWNSCKKLIQLFSVLNIYSDDNIRTCRH